MTAQPVEHVRFDQPNEVRGGQGWRLRSTGTGASVWARKEGA